MIKKIIIFISIVLLLIISYNYLNPPFAVKNSEALSLGFKVKPFRDSINVFIPYEITVYNNRYQSLELGRIYDENDRDYRPNLLYNKDGVELGRLYNDSKKQYEDEPYWLKLEYRDIIFPFTKRVFYYYRKHTLSNKNDVFNIKEIDRDSLYKQLAELNYNINLNKNNHIIDSLYKVNRMKIFNVDFDTERFTLSKYIKAKINSNEQIAINIDYRDSMQNMTKAQKRAYVLKLAKTNTKLDDF
ncbi:hypothetical protein QSV08_12555 [Maribacter sp. BPC-D8]|uniref:hypothetical protein n=1 Tax=Maribacter sp. BPC-D8 TaxID=3053613 RepID=UPI002B476587|nr:hypothetical protein [Maribacter sp. BPC-D8]WRI28056.1 hypothetical protein QSV08_12555 [Maribacter sp. BPC-D8]